MTSVKQLIDLMSNLKMNQLQLYMEHTFAYSDHRVVWQDADPFTPAGTGFGSILSLSLSPSSFIVFL
jgi:hypothetical protein